MEFEAYFYSGLSTTAQACLLSSPAQDALRIEMLPTDSLPAQILHLQPSEWQVSEAFSHTPRIVTVLAPQLQGQIEVAESADLQAWLTAQGKGTTWVQRAQISWRKAGAAAVALVLAVAAFYQWGLPHMARIVSDWIPQSYVQKLDDESLAQIDKHWAKPTELSMDTQRRIGDKFKALQAPDSSAANAPAASIRLLFRASKMGPNAVALPAGTVIVFDELVKLSPNDEAVLGVLAHEWGHLAKRHALTGLIESTATGLFMSVYLGDASSLIATVGSGLGFLHYSRQHETESDTFAIQTLKKNGLAGTGTAELFERMMNWDCYSNGQSGETCAAESKRKNAKNDGIPEFLSSHPATPERIVRFKNLLN
jgi:Zn-dependent protease with chaperone function